MFTFYCDTLLKSQKKKKGKQSYMTAYPSIELQNPPPLLFDDQFIFNFTIRVE
jgi:uncharacterized lipoprotein